MMNMSGSQMAHALKVTGFGSMPRGIVVLMVLAGAYTWVYANRKAAIDGLFA